ncbi:hypothetical protein ACU686_23750 [Yinghuangia aomiensis]
MAKDKPGRDHVPDEGIPLPPAGAARRADAGWDRVEFAKPDDGGPVDLAKPDEPQDHTAPPEPEPDPPKAPGWLVWPLRIVAFVVVIPVQVVKGLVKRSSRRSAGPRGLSGARRLAVPDARTRGARARPGAGVAVPARRTGGALVAAAGGRRRGGAGAGARGGRSGTRAAPSGGSRTRPVPRCGRSAAASGKLGRLALAASAARMAHRRRRAVAGRRRRRSRARAGVALPIPQAGAAGGRARARPGTPGRRSRPRLAVPAGAARAARAGRGDRRGAARPRQAAGQAVRLCCAAPLPLCSGTAGRALVALGRAS